ncbi:hypothetical protein NDU88_005795 [Pleurodeles waltl]|uniref:Uncharacterized protein n=1 Tax=Pleurodeles waltl TaxID=8319 RepID=A0AAV7NWA0_PLEWA|nr:hypothetical protein NDU88_005795 [Pleurodeles waltl]
MVSEKQEATLPLPTARKEASRVPEEENRQAVNPTGPEAGGALDQPPEPFEEHPRNHEGACHVPGGAWQSRVRSYLKLAFVPSWLPGRGESTGAEGLKG